MTEPAFRHRRRVADPVLEVAAAAERAVRAALRRLRPAQREPRHPLLDGEAGPPGPPAPDPRPTSAPPTATHPAQPPRIEGAPLLYLPALPWHFRFQRPQQLALALAARGVPVVWVEGFLRTWIQPRSRLTAPAPGVQVVRLRIAGRPDPFREPLSSTAALELATLIAAGLLRPPRAILAQLPFWSPLARVLATRFGVPLIYDRIDLHTAFPGVPPEVGAAEEELIAAAGLVTATSGALAELPRRLGVRTVVLRNACDPASFAVEREAPEPDRGIVAGFVGALDDRIDAAALETAARAHPGWGFRLAGRIESPAVAALRRLSNVELTGEIPHRRVPAFLAGLDLGLVPYRDTPLTRAIDPVKLYEMLAAGLPVALRRLPGTRPAGAAALAPPMVYPYDDPADLPALLARAQAEDAPEHRASRRAAAREESWDRRAAELLNLLESPP